MLKVHECNATGQLAPLIYKGYTMSHSSLLKKLRDEQRDEIMRKKPAERLLMALELSDACAQLNDAARKALEEKRATAKA
jgi:predicted house-cleaning noncanonical NTP pyrophosphatase (MazG superfamily)